MVTEHFETSKPDFRLPAYLYVDLSMEGAKCVPGLSLGNTQEIPGYNLVDAS